ncbi:MAG: PHP domain-containing protein [Firmicutes bacterium]|nr:PHP domain-containing protein [Bacillota bacterium]
MLRIDFHVHSVLSPDSYLTPEQIVDLAQRRGLDGVAIVDHGTAAGSLAAARRLSRPGLLVIPGGEWATPEGHLVGLFLEREPSIGQGLFPVAEVITALREAGGLVVLAHPYQLHQKVIDEVLSAVNAVEVWNSRAGSALHPDANRRAAELAAAAHKPGLGGSDAHTAREVGLGWTELFLPKGATAEEVRRAIETGKIRAAGRDSPLFLPRWSNLVRDWRLRRWSSLPKALIRLGLALCGRAGLSAEAALRRWRKGAGDGNDSFINAVCQRPPRSRRLRSKSLRKHHGEYETEEK